MRSKKWIVWLVLPFAISLAPAAALAGPVQKEANCPTRVVSELTKSQIAKGETFPAPELFVSAPLLQGKLYCTDERDSSGGMFSVGKTYWQLHERGNYQGIAYRIDYYKGWAEVFLNERAKPDRRTNTVGNDKQDYFADVICRYDPYGDYPADHAKHMVSGKVTCAAFASDDGSAIFYFTDHANGLLLADKNLTGTNGDITVPGNAAFKPGAVVIPKIHNYGNFSNNTYDLAFRYLQPLTTRGPVKFDTPYVQQNMAISLDSDPNPIISNLIKAIVGSDHFLINKRSYNNGRIDTYEKIPSARLKNAVTFLIPLAQKMTADGQ